MREVLPYLAIIVAALTLASAWGMNKANVAYQEKALFNFSERTREAFLAVNARIDREHDRSVDGYNRHDAKLQSHHTAIALLNAGVRHRTPTDNDSDDG